MKTGYTLIELLVVTIITVIVCFVLLGGLGIGLFPHYSVGERTGYVTKLSEKGIIFKTWEGEMQIGVGQQASLQPPWVFSVPDPSVREQLQASLGKQVRLTYNQYLSRPFWKMGTPYNINQVLLLEVAPQGK